MPNGLSLRVSVRFRVIAFLGLGALALAAPRLTAQTAPVTGVPPLSTVQSLPEGALNLADLNLHLAIPIVNKAGRGTPLTYTLGFDSDVWTPVTNGKWAPSPTWGWTAETDAATGYVLYSAQSYQCVYGQYPNLQYYNWTQYSGFEYVDTSGQVHNYTGYVLDPPSGPCGPSGPSSYSGSDGQFTLSVAEGYGGLSFSALSTSGVLYNPPGYQYGNHVSNGVGSVTDTNGNILSINGSTFTDTLGVSELSISGAGTPASPVSYAVAGGGTDTIHYTNFSVGTGFTCSGVTNFSGTVPLPTSVALPGGTYDLNYGGAGRLTSVTLPTGATITYSYSGGSGGINCQDGSPATLTRTVNGQTWTYVHSVGSNSVGTTTVTDPAGNVTTYTFFDDYEVERVVNQGSSSTLETVYTCYNNSNCTAASGSGSFTLPITSRAVITKLPNGQEDETVTDYDASLDPTEVGQYDWGSGSPGSLLRKTLIGYAALSGIPDRPSQVEIEDGGGNLAAETTYAYDQTALQATSGLPQHGNPPNSSRGNLTTINRCAASSGGSCARWLTSTLSYFDTGEVYQATAPNGAVTTYTYASSSPGCAGAFPTNVALPKDAQGNSYSRQYSWNCTGGVLDTSTGENGNVTSYAYSDPLWRLTGVSDPDGGGETISYLSPTETETSTKISSSLAKTQYALLDNLGRPSFSQTVDGSAPCDTVQTTYDSATDSVQVSVPYPTACQTNIGNGSAFTKTQFDALGRVSTITAANGAVTSYTYTGPAVTVTGPAPGSVSHILQANGLGELAEVCEVTNLTGSGACNTAAGGTGYLTTYTYDALGDLTGVDEAGQTRSFSYDALGRVTAETTPESGTTDFAYDTDSTCGTANGTLVRRVDAVGNVTCYAHDLLGRVTAITYPSGQYASVTPAKTFVYDAATVNGQAMANAAGRLAEAYTGPSGSKITDEGFGYDSMGRSNSLWEDVPGSNGWYHIPVTYSYTGRVTSIAATGIPYFTYNLDSLGRVLSTNNASPLQSVAYNPAGQVTQLQWASGGSDAFSYAPNGLMAQYQYTVNGATDTGSLSWNADGTLGSLQITDSIPGTSDSQTCSYGYDSLGRVASVDCPNVWSQSFTYDAFGNIKKSGSLNWQPNYSPATNQANISYDGDGDVTNDGSNTYAWDADGKMIQVNAQAITYDALGRMVANAEGEIAYLPTGYKLAIMNGQNGAGVYFPLPGGAHAFDLGGTWLEAHSDWLASGRLTTTTAPAFYHALSYAPFGEVYANAGAGSSEWFTGIDADTAPNLWDFPAREYASVQGRWLSPDPSGLAAVNPANPQSWNAYAYVANQPLTATDPLGLCPGGCGGQQIGGGNPLTPSAQCEVEGLPDNCWLNSLATDFLCGTGQPYQQLDPSCRQFAFTGPSGGIVVGSRSARIGPLSPPARPANAAPPTCPGGPELVAGGSAGFAAPLGNEATAQFDLPLKDPVGGEKLQLTGSLNGGIPEVHAIVFAGFDQLSGPTADYVNVGLSGLGRISVSIPIKATFPYVNGLIFQAGAGGSVLGLQATITVPAETGCVGRP